MSKKAKRITKPLDEDSLNLIDFLKDLPKDSILPWACDHMSEEFPWVAGWADIRLANDILEKLDTRWAWTIDPPWETFEKDDSDLDDPWNFIAEPDLLILTIYDETDMVYEEAAPINKILGPGEIKELQEALDNTDGKGFLTGYAGWSPERISDALNQWVSVWAGRPDIHFEWTPELGLSIEAQKAQEILAKVESGEIQTYLVKAGESEGGEGITIKVTEEIMDAMIQAEIDNFDE